MRELACGIAIATLVVTAAEAKNMFYLLAATWCPVGETTNAFTIGDDGALIFDWNKGATCWITSVAKVMDQPMGVYNLVWKCGKDIVPERLETYMSNTPEEGRRFFLTRHLNEPRKRETYEQCELRIPGSDNGTK